MLFKVHQGPLLWSPLQCAESEASMAEGLLGRRENVYTHKYTHKIWKRYVMFLSPPFTMVGIAIRSPRFMCLVIESIYTIPDDIIPIIQ